METVVDTMKTPVPGLGERIRQARKERGMSQEQLAQPEFTKSYISAIERSKARPSLKALALLAGRLDLPITTLLTAPVPAIEVPDIEALDEEFGYQLDHAKFLLNSQRGEAALQVLNAAETDYQPHLEEFAARTLYRFHRLRGLAYLRLADSGSARQELSQALRLAQQLDDPQEAERVRNALGAVYNEQDLPEQALEYHRQGLEAIHAGAVKDLNLKLAIYANLANAYWALNDTQHAISTYHEALGLLNDVTNLEQQARIYWGLGSAYKDAGDMDRARLYAGRSLSISEAAQNRIALAQVSANLGEILTKREEYQEAEQELTRALALLQETNQPVMLSMVYERYAMLDVARGRLADAQAHAEQSRQLIAGVFEQENAAAGNDAAAKATATRAYALALAVSAQVAEQSGRPQEADAFFTQALAAIEQTEYPETISDIELRYADMLTARGAHADASKHYRAAVQQQGRFRRH